MGEHWRCPLSRAHPRSRGENTYAGEDRNQALGSSPLTRGKQGQWVRHVATRGLIPAHAGKTTQGTSPNRWRRAHPRSRGENTLRVTALAA